ATPDIIISTTWEIASNVSSVLTQPFPGLLPPAMPSRRFQPALRTPWGDWPPSVKETYRRPRWRKQPQTEMATLETELAPRGATEKGNPVTRPRGAWPDGMR